MIEDEDFLPSDSPVAVTFQAVDEKIENVLRPQYLEDFQGQKQLKENLGVFIKAARERGEALDHTFLIGPPGLGKTTLASIIANEMHSELRMTSAPALEKPKDLAGILTIYSIYYISMIPKVQEYGKLKAIGATKKQIRQIVFREDVVLIDCLLIAARSRQEFCRQCRRAKQNRCS